MKFANAIVISMFVICVAAIYFYGFLLGAIGERSEEITPVIYLSALITVASLASSLVNLREIYRESSFGRKHDRGR